MLAASEPGAGYFATILGMFVSTTSPKGATALKKILTNCHPLFIVSFSEYFRCLSLFLISENDKNDKVVDRATTQKGIDYLMNGR